MTSSPLARLLLLLGVLAVACKAPLPDGGPPSFQQDFCPADAGPPPAHASGPSPGCVDGGTASGVFPLTPMGAQGVLVVPALATAGTPVPLVLVFHGAEESGDEIRGIYGIEEAADGGALFAYPDAAFGTWALGPSVDLTHVDRLVQRISQTYCIDQDRIFAAGFSAGAVFTHWVGCVRSETFRALAVTAGTDVRFDTACCTGTMSAIGIHGMDDPAITYAQGLAARARLLATDHCSPTPTPLDANCQDFPGCSAGLAVEWCGHPGGHVIPDWAGGEVWSFFNRFP